MEITYPLRSKWVKLEIGEEERIACSDCGEMVSDQHVSLKLDMDKKIVVFVECEECEQKWRELMKQNDQVEVDT